MANNELSGSMLLSLIDYFKKINKSLRFIFIQKQLVQLYLLIKFHNLKNFIGGYNLSWQVMAKLLLYIIKVWKFSSGLFIASSI